MRVNRQILETLYRRYNRREYVTPDPIQTLYDYPEIGDREIAGFVAAFLAYGKVAQILRSVAIVCQRMGRSPCEFVTHASSRQLHDAFRDFRHRFTSGEDLAALLSGVGRVIAEHGSLNACFLNGLRREDDDIRPALQAFVAEISGRHRLLLPRPARGSACKRLNLFLRWMVRRDDVDPGGWAGVSPSKLIVPLDTHMHRMARRLQLTRRRASDMETAMEVTAAFRKINPADPVKYDFVLTRMGIRKDVEWEMTECRRHESGRSRDAHTGRISFR